MPYYEKFYRINAMAKFEEMDSLSLRS